MFEQIMIASVTKMKMGLCIGGYVMPREWWQRELTLGPTRSVRLIPAGARWHSNTNDWQPGQIIRAEISERAGLVLPHTEDVTLLRWGADSCGGSMHAADTPCTCARREAPKTYPLVLRDIAARSALRGSVSDLFDGKISRKPDGRAVVADHTLGYSTEWWIPDFRMLASDHGYIPIRMTTRLRDSAAMLEALEGDGSMTSNKNKWTFKYVGVNPVCRKKVAEYTKPMSDYTLVCRMSLARWFAASSDPEPICYGDLSAVWVASQDRTRFFPLECDTPGRDGECLCDVQIDDDEYFSMWGSPRHNPTAWDDLPF